MKAKTGYVMTALFFSPILLQRFVKCDCDWADFWARFENRPRVRVRVTRAFEQGPLEFLAACASDLESGHFLIQCEALLQLGTYRSLVRIHPQVHLETL